MPIDFVDRRFAPKVKDAPDGRVATITLTVEKHNAPSRRGLPYRVRCYDETGTLDLVFFNAHKDYLHKHLPVGGTVIVSGQVEYFRGHPQIVHPDAIGTEEERAEIETVDPVYPLTQGVTNKAVRKAIKHALAFPVALPEWLDPAWQKRQNWKDWRSSLETVQNPPGANGLNPLHPARARLAYDELLANQLALALVRYKQRRVNGRVFQGDNSLRQKMLDTLPFTLTEAQEKALQDIYSDMAAPARMLRLLQGDVGSGKTVVAALALLQVIECGAQGVLMAPDRNPGAAACGKSKAVA